VKHKDRWRPIAVLAALALVTAACTTTTTSTTAAPATTATTQAAATSTTAAASSTTAAAGATTTTSPVRCTTGADDLVLWVYDEGRTQILCQLGQEFQAEFGVGVTVESHDLADLRNQLALGAGPDLAIIPHDNLGAIVVSGAAAPVDLGDKLDQYLPATVDGFTYNGELYGVPLAIENIGFFYNTDMVTEPPATWAEVQEVGQQLVNDGEADYAIGLPDLTYNSYPVYTSYGGYIFGQTDEGFNAEDIGMNNAGMVEGLTWIQGMADAGLILENVDWEASHVQFETGKQAFILTGPWAINRFDAAGVPYAIGAFPAATAGGDAGYPFLGVQGLVVNANSDNLLLAQTFATEKIANEETYQRIFEAEPRPSAWKTVFDQATDANTVAFNEAGTGAIPMPNIPEMGFVWDNWVNAGTAAITGTSPQEALDTAVQNIETAIAGAG
jgi:maltose-binding protein MalE